MSSREKWPGVFPPSGFKPLAIEDQPDPGFSYSTSAHTHTQTQIQPCADQQRPEKSSKTIFPFAELILHVRIPGRTVDMAGAVSAEEDCSVFPLHFACPLTCSATIAVPEDELCLRSYPQSVMFDFTEL